MTLACGRWEKVGWLCASAHVHAHNKSVGRMDERHILVPSFLGSSHLSSLFLVFPSSFSVYRRPSGHPVAHVRTHSGVSGRGRFFAPREWRAPQAKEERRTQRHEIHCAGNKWHSRQAMQKCRIMQIK